MRQISVTRGGTNPLSSSSTIMLNSKLDKIVSCFTSHLGTRIVVSCQSCVDFISTDITFFEECNQGMHGMPCRCTSAYGLFHFSWFILHASKVVGGLGLEFIFLWISPMMINVTLMAMRLTMTKICCPDIKFHYLRLILLNTIQSLVTTIHKQINWSGIICLDLLHDFFISIFNCFPHSLWFTKWTCTISPRLPVRVDTPSTNAFPAAYKSISVASSSNCSCAIAKSWIGTDDIVADGSEIHDSNFIGIGRKQIWQSSFAGGSLNNAASCSSAERKCWGILEQRRVVVKLGSTSFACFFMLLPMIHWHWSCNTWQARLTSLETDAPCNAAIGTT